MPNDFIQGSGFRVCGTVLRKRIPDSRKIAFLTLNVERPRSSVKLDMRTFDRGLIDDIGSLADGQLVEVTGAVDIEPLKDRSGHEVKVDGYNRWFPALTIKVLRIHGASRPAAPSEPDPGGPPLDDDGVPF